MNRSLTVLLPVQNTRATLSSTVHRLLDVLPELTGQFEVLIVDNGAEEATTEAAHDLAKDFPQVRVVRQESGSSREAAVRIGLKQSQGDVVLLGEPQCADRIDDVVRLWREVGLNHRPLPSPPSAAVVEPGREGGFRLLGPQTRLRAEAPEPPRGPNFLDRLKRFALGE